MSLFSVTISDSPKYSTSGGSIKGDLQQRITNYGHTIGANIGFDTCDITLTPYAGEFPFWHDVVIGKHILVSYGGLVVWEGFVDEIVMTIGPATISRGPLLDVANRVRVTYQDFNPASNTNLGQLQTAEVNDELSQDSYFILEEDVSGGQGTTAQAEDLRDAYLEEFKEPVPKTDISGGGSEVSVQVTCKGYGHLLNRFYYFNANTGTQFAHTKVKNVLDFDPNGLFSSENALIENIGIVVGQFEDDSKTGLEVIQEMVEYGADDNERMTFSVYENRTAYLEKAPNNPLYEIFLGFGGPNIVKYLHGGDLHPWLVRPGNVAVIRNMPVGIRSQSDVKRSPDYVFIENVSFTAPGNLDISGGALDTINQRLARFGFGVS